MSFSYNVNQIAASGTNTIDYVRWALDDIDSTAYDIENEEITVVAAGILNGTQTEKNILTAIKIAEKLWRRYSKQVSFSSAGTNMQLSDRANHWLDVINDLRLQYAAIAGISTTLYPYRPHYNEQLVIEAGGWIPYGDA